MDGQHVHSGLVNDLVHDLFHSGRFYVHAIECGVPIFHKAACTFSTHMCNHLRAPLSDYGLWAAALERARHPCVPTVSVVVREAAERTDRMLGEERNLPAVSSYWRTARNSDSTSDRSDSSLSLSAA